MRDFIFRIPTRIYYGVGAVNTIGNLCTEKNAKRVFILTDPNVVKLPIVDEIKSSLEANGINFEVYSDTIVDPTIEVVDSISVVLKNSRADLVVAVGGGSTIDTAKAVCTLQTNEGNVKDYIFGGSKSVLHPILPLICIPTTAGSGSEVTTAAVISDLENRVKASISHDYLMPSAAVLDPKAITTVSPEIMAATGMDALTHAIEAYVSLNAEPFSDALVIQTIKMTAENLRNAVSNPNNLEARGNMLMASCMASMAFTNGGLGAVHGIAQAIGGIAHVTHGIANAVMLPYVMKRNYVGNLQKFKDIARAMGEKVDHLGEREAAERAIAAVEELSNDIFVPKTIRELGVTREMFPDIVAGTMSYRLLAVNPCKLEEKDILNILEAAY